MKKFLLVLAGIFLTSLSVKAEENKHIQMWVRENKPVLFVQELDGGEWQWNNPYFYRDGFSSDGSTRLMIAKVVASTDPKYKKDTLVLCEWRCEKDDSQKHLPYWLIFVSSQTPAIPLTKDGTALYISAEDTFFFNAEALKNLTLPSGSIWEQMKSVITKHNSDR